jgi:esterase/lipase superfamily enzyme
MRALILVCLALGLAGCAPNRDYTPIQPAAAKVGTLYPIFTGTTRGQHPDGSYGAERSERLQLLELTVSVPPTHQPGELRFGYDRADPNTDFVLAERRSYSGAAAFRTRVGEQMRTRPAGQRDITVFVHGYNSTQIETAYRMAQIAHDLGSNGVQAIYSWPSRGRPLGYVYDSDSMIFARDGLERYLRMLSSTNPDRLVLVAHSMGSTLAMETLRQMDHKDPGWPARNIDAVILMSPDLDVQIFSVQMRGLSAVPNPFVVFSSSKDRALNISARLRGTANRERLGSIRSLDEVGDLPIEVVDITDFSSSAASSHFTAVTSPEMLEILIDARESARILDTEDASLVELVTGETIADEHGSYRVRLDNPETSR